MYPFTDKNWVKTNFTNGTGMDEKLAFNTTKSLVYNTNKKVISNFTDGQSEDEKLPITNFVYKDIKQPQVNVFDMSNFYASRTYDKQLPTEGDIKYLNYSGLVSSYQTTSIFNTPYFINSIQEGVEKSRNKKEYPYVSSALSIFEQFTTFNIKRKIQIIQCFE